jgi:hypothetical protein
VRFHASGGPYDPFVVKGDKVIANPLATAMAAMSRWLPVGSDLQPLRSPKGVVATGVSGTAKGAQLICDNETTQPQTLNVPVSAGLHAEILSPEHSGIQRLALAPVRGRALLKLAANSIAVLTPAP